MTRATQTVLLTVLLITAAGCQSGGLRPADSELGAHVLTISVLEGADATEKEADTLAQIAGSVREVAEGGADDPNALAEGIWAELIAAYGVDSPFVAYGLDIARLVWADIVGAVLTEPVAVYVAAGARGVERGAFTYARVHPKRPIRARSEAEAPPEPWRPLRRWLPRPSQNRAN